MNKICSSSDPDSRSVRIKGYTLVELMIVVAIIAFLSMITMPSFIRFLAKAKRAEAYMNLSAIYKAQKAYWAEHHVYSKVLSGPDGIGWKPEGSFNYSYGFADGNEGQHYFIGKLGAPAAALKDSTITNNSFLIVAAADIDGDDKGRGDGKGLDILAVKDTGEIVILQDDLA